MDEQSRLSKITELRLEVFDIKRGLRQIEAGAKKVEQDLKELNQTMQKLHTVREQKFGLPPKESKVKIYTGIISKSVSESELDKLMKSL